MILGTKYDDDLKAKVFIVRGDERYTHSTITSLEVDYTANNRSYLTVTLTAYVKNHLGQSQVTFYDGDTALGVVVCNSNQSSVSLQVRVDYGYHKFRAKYMGNSSCLSSKSGIVELTVDDPNLTRSRIELGTIEEYYPIGEGATIGGVLLATDSEDVATGRVTGETITFILDGETFGTTTISQYGTFSFTIHAYELDEGVHNGIFSFDGGENYLGYDEEFTFIVSHDNCNITVTPKYPKIGAGDTAVFIVTAKSFNGGALANETVTLDRED